MARRRISQREAHQAVKRVAELERIESARQLAWSADYPGGVEIARGQWDRDGGFATALHTARKLGHAVVAVTDGSGLVRFMALKQGR